MNETLSVSHDVTLIMFQWGHGRTLLPEQKEDEITKKLAPITVEDYPNYFSTEPVFFTTNPSENSVNNILHVSVSAPKSGEGNMIVQCAGLMPNLDANFSVVGTWGILVTSVNARFSHEYQRRIKATGDKIAAIHNVITDERFVVRFVGQLVTSSGHYFVDGQGTRRRDMVMRFKSWSAALDVPLAFFPTSEINATGPLSISKTKNKGLDDDYNSLVKQLQKAAFAVFEWPKVAIMFFNYYNANASTQDIYKSIAKYKNTLSHGPLLPPDLVNCLMGPRTVGGSGNDLLQIWQKFMVLLAGVQKWGGDENGEGGVVGTGSASKTNAAGGDGIVGFLENFKEEGQKSWILSETEQTKRPFIPVQLDVMKRGFSIRSFVNMVVASSNANESYTTLRYTKNGDKIITIPTYVVRDIPYSVKRSFEEWDKQSKKKYPWTYFDDLPAINLRSSQITSINITSSLDNSSNAFIITPASAVAAGPRQAADMANSLVLTNNQFRYGGKAMFVNVYEVNATNSSLEVDLEHGGEWTKELAKRFSVWHGLGFLYMSGSIMFKDYNNRPIPGDNVIFNLNKLDVEGREVNRLCAHIENVEYRYSVRDGGQVSCESVIQFSRAMIFRSDKLKAEKLQNLVPFAPFKLFELTNPNEIGGGFLTTFFAEGAEKVRESLNTASAVEEAKEQSLPAQESTDSTENSSDEEEKKLPPAKGAPAPTKQAKTKTEPVVKPKEQEDPDSTPVVPTPQPTPQPTPIPGKPNVVRRTVKISKNLFEVDSKKVSLGKNSTDPESGGVVVTSKFGVKRSYEGSNYTHRGVDYAPYSSSASKEYKVLSLSRGKVISVKQHERAGTYVVIQPLPPDLGPEYHTKMQIKYAHLSSVDVKPDQIVEAGTVIGTMGSSGRVRTGNKWVDENSKKNNPNAGKHLHLEFVDSSSGGLGTALDAQKILLEGKTPSLEFYR